MNGKTLQKLDPESTDLSTQDPIPDTWFTRWISLSIAYLFLFDEAEAWIGDIRELRNDLVYQEKRSIRYSRIMEVLWVGGLVFDSIAKRASDLFF